MGARRRVSREHVRQELQALRGQAQCVLAVLVLASEWPHRFAGGWVTSSEIARHGINAGGNDSATRGRVIRRAWDELMNCGVALPLQTDVLPENRRRRRLGTRSRALADWLFADGHRWVLGESWRAFLSDRLGESPTDRLLLGNVDVLIAKALGTLDRPSEGLSIVEKLLSLSEDVSDERRRLLLLKAELLCQRESDFSDAEDAEAILRDLAGSLGSPETLEDRVTLARISLTRAYAHFLSNRGRLFLRSNWDTVGGTILEQTEVARAVVSILGPSDIARMNYVHGRFALSLLYATTASTSERDAALQEADRRLTTAATHFMTAGESVAVAECMSWMGEARFLYHNLSDVRMPLPEGLETREVQDTLKWFESAIRVMGEVAPSRRWPLQRDRARAADCLCILLAIELETASWHVLEARLSAIRGHIARIEDRHCLAFSWSYLEELARRIGDRQEHRHPG